MFLNTPTRLGQVLGHCSRGCISAVAAKPPHSAMAATWCRRLVYTICKKGFLDVLDTSIEHGQGYALNSDLSSGVGQVLPQSGINALSDAQTLFRAPTWVSSSNDSGSSGAWLPIR